jgi:hypothetical protein
VKMLQKSQSETSSDWERQKTTNIQGYYSKLHSYPYYNQNEVWVDREISESWFHKHFVPKLPFLKRGLQKVLLLDNALSHPSESVVTSNNGPTVVKIWAGGGRPPPPPPPPPKS